MAQDPGEQSEYAGQHAREDEVEAGKVETVNDPERPTCPRCGWHSTRLSNTTNALDSILRTFSLRAFRCLSCGNRFRVFRSSPEA
jgi:DNA-directed RNA polymerase subunit M/transcription elongation factor TFIIS